MREIADEAVRDAASVEHVVEWQRDGGEWQVELGPGELPPLEVDAEHPYLLAYTSGTTGRPKGALHVHGGFLVSIAREVAYQTDVKAGDRVLFATDMGWIMGPWTVVGAGACGASVVYPEGAPDWPHDRLWATIEEERATLLGVSPTLIRALLQKGEPHHDLSSLKAICTTGEPWNRDPYLWLFEHVGGGRAPIVNISGGTEVGACFLSTCIVEPVKPVALGFPALGQDMDVVDSAGNSVRGEVGELVCRRPWPGMTRGVWRDPERYLDTYWRRFPGVWTHGDWASIDEDGYWFLHGRSDDTLNIAGKRIGPAELESAAIASGIVAEAAAVGDPARGQGRDGVAVLRREARRGARRGACRRRRRGRARQGVQAGAGRVGQRTAEDAQCEDRATRRPREGDRARSRGPVVVGESRSVGGDRGPCQSLTDRSLSSPAAAAASARTSRASCDPPARLSRSRRARATSSSRSRSRSTRSRWSPTSPDRDSVDSMLRAVESSRGPVDILCANAGVASRDERAWEADPAEWWRTFEVNVLGVYLCCRAVIPGMLSRGRGRIIITGSGAAYLPGSSNTAYSASKAAVSRFGEVLSKQLEGRIPVFIFSPGLVQTRMTSWAPDNAPWTPAALRATPRPRARIGKSGRPRGALHPRGARRHRGSDPSRRRDPRAGSERDSAAALASATSSRVLDCEA